VVIQKKRPSFYKILEYLSKMYDTIPMKDKSQISVDFSVNKNLIVHRTKSRALLIKEEVKDIKPVPPSVPFNSNSSDDNQEIKPKKKKTKIIRTESEKKRKENDLLLDSNNDMEISVSILYSEPNTNKDNVQNNDTVTCIIPSKWSSPIAKLEIKVNEHFSRLHQSIEKGLLKVDKDRYVLFRANSLSIDFNEMIKESFDFNDSLETFEFSQNFLYDLGYSIGKVDSINFKKKNQNIKDIKSLDQAGLVFIAYCGIGYVELLPFTKYSDDVEKMISVMKFKYSYESDAWGNQESKEHNSCCCVMAAGYTAGWGEVMLESIQATAEILCRARGDDHCLFIRTAPHKLNDSVIKFCKKQNIDSHGGIPTFLRNRKRTLLHIDLEQNNMEESWLNKNWKKIFKKSKETKTDPFNSKVFNNSEYLSRDVIELSTNELDKFYIDPRHGIVELADDKCVLLRGDGISRDFFYHGRRTIFDSGKIKCWLQIVCFKISF